MTREEWKNLSVFQRAKSFQHGPVIGLSVCLSVCQSVSRITRKLTSRFFTELSGGVARIKEEHIKFWSRSVKQNGKQIFFFLHLIWQTFVHCAFVVAFELVIWSHISLELNKLCRPGCSKSLLSPGWLQDSPRPPWRHLDQLIKHKHAHKC